MKTVINVLNDDENVVIISKDEVVITKKEYEDLKRDSEIYNWLEMKGVDNWSHYSHPPDREDYDTDEEYEKAYEDALRFG